jgi:hypothetical protein
MPHACGIRVVVYSGLGMAGAGPFIVLEPHERSTEMSDPIIKIGSTGATVTKAQQALYCRRYLVDLSEVDGIVGPKTWEALYS